MIQNSDKASIEGIVSEPTKLVIYSYINSKAIRDYLRKINYEFTFKEAAWLIYQCNSLSLLDKHTAWRELIRVKESGESDLIYQTDDGLDERFNYLPHKSIQELIKRQIGYDEKMMELFNRKGDSAVYQYSFYCKGDSRWCEDYYGIYSSLDECFQEIEEDMDLGIEVIDISKKWFGSNKTIKLRYLPDKTVIDIDSDYRNDDEIDSIEAGFEELWFEFPVPFEKGDILVPVKGLGPEDLWSESGPLVMDSISPWEKELNDRMKNSTCGDNSDMLIWGFFQDPDGRIYHECAFNYMNYEYFEGPFNGPRRLLIALSNFLKGKITVEVLLSAYRKIIMDEVSDDVMLHSWYSEDTLRLCGLNDVVKDNQRHLVESGLNPDISFNKRNYFIDDDYTWNNSKELCEKCHRIASYYYQPKEMLFIYGCHGCGKTTLLQCLGNMAKQLSRPKLIYITAENFVNEVISAIRSNTMAELRAKYRNLDYFIVDDIQKLCGKETSIEEFTDTLNDLLTKGAQIVISSDRPLNSLELPEILLSKLSFATQMEMVSENEKI